MQDAPTVLASARLAALLGRSRTPPEEYRPAAEWRESPPPPQEFNAGALERIDAECAAGGIIPPQRVADAGAEGGPGWRCGYQ
jgi:hypothetical protein